MNRILIFNVLICFQLLLCADARGLQQPPTFEEVERQIRVVGLRRDIDKIIGWIAQDPDELDNALEFARRQKNPGVLLREMVVSAARHSSWEKVQQVIQEIDQFKRKPGYTPQAPLASVQIFGVYSETAQQKVAFSSAMNAIETCERDYTKVKLLTKLAKHLSAKGGYWQDGLAAFADAVKDLDVKRRESKVYDFLVETAEHGTELQIVEAKEKLGFAIESDQSKIAVTRGLLNRGHYAAAMLTISEVKSPLQRAKLILRFLRDYRENRQGKLDDSALIFSELKRAIDQEKDGVKKIDLLLGYFESTKRHHVELDDNSLRQQLKDFVIGVKPNQVGPLFGKIGRAYVIFRGLKEDEISAVAINLLDEYATSKTGTWGNASISATAQIAAKGNDVIGARSFIEKIDNQLTKMNGVNQVVKYLASTGEIDAALKFLDLCDSERSRLRVKATIFDALVRNGHLQQAKTMIQYIDPNQAITFESIRFLVRDLVSAGMQPDDPWLQQLGSRSRNFEALIKLGIWLAEADAFEKRAAVQLEENR